MAFKIKKQNSLLWLLEPLQGRPDFIQKKMFGLEAGYLRGLLIAVLGDDEEPWHGLLLPTSREHHPSLMAEFPELVSHPILGKWLYLSEANPAFEELATKLIQRMLKGDPRFGVEPKPKKSKNSQKTKKR